MKSMNLTDRPSSQIRHDFLEYPMAPPLADGSMVEVADGLLWLRMPMPMSLDHINVYLLEDDDGWFILDTGLHTEETRELWLKIVAQHCNNKAIKGVICTHFHYDHSGLASWLMQTFNVPLYMTHGEFFTLKSFSGAFENLGNDHQLDFYHRAGMPKNEVMRVIDACRKDPFVQYCPPAYSRIREGDVFTIGQRRWKIVIGEGHSPEHACLYCEEDKIILAGDQLLPHISSNILVNEFEPQGQQLANWFRSLERIQTLDPQTLVLPAHGPIFRQMHLRAQQLVDHHVETLDKLRKFVSEKAEFTAYQAMKCLFNRKLSAFDSMMALGETLAHLNWLEANNEFLCQRDNDSGIYTYLALAKTNKTG